MSKILYIALNPNKLYNPRKHNYLREDGIRLEHLGYKIGA
jgi:hypothetical protein